jgi:hypothetical protein
MKIELRPGTYATRLTLGNALMTSSTSCSPCRSMSAVEKAVMLWPTSCRLSSRRVAVTMIVSSFPDSAGRLSGACGFSCPGEAAG